MIVHSGMVSHHSAALERLIDGEMSEAITGVATLKDVDTGTFARFSQWGYTGDYTAVEPETLLDSPIIGTDRSDAEVKADDSNYDDVPMVVPFDPERDTFSVHTRKAGQRRVKKFSADWELGPGKT